ncbi:ABC transporter substrate-binding protein [Dysgonomonas sp. 25]|uniref:ABC transporter substrate-binding protein n=1 Tax=Dysgonomonas sp. 25 TaxID=2302933 RepID=UPI0013D826CA|nr:ABC transporter substrate-binding protein [Dysgonomonas sp. 25]NDV69707.1 ABC transporter substrate-binding protein [Dysgonomonas sp. 25]
MNKIMLILSCALLFATACNKTPQNVGGNFELRYAKAFTVDEQEDYTLIKLIDPWDTTRLLQTYVLVDRNKELPENLPAGVLVRTPIRSAVAYSTVNCTTLDELNSLDIIKGVCEPHYIKIPQIQEGVKNGTIADVGAGHNPDVEKIIELDPEVIFASPIAGQGFGQVEKTKIPIIQTIDYLENEPLARAEWIRFYSFFTNTRQRADSLFSLTESNYNEVKELVRDGKKHPSVFMDTPYQGNWNMPGGKSYVAVMLKDAGANYVWADDESTKFHPLPFEAVLDKAGDADMWLIKYYSPEDLTYQSLKKENAKYVHFKAWKDKKIYGCNTIRNDYFGDLPIHPDWILKDMAAAFHPELFPAYTPRYYERLKD